MTNPPFDSGQYGPPVTGNPEPAPRKSNRGKIIAVVAGVVALLIGVGIGRSAANQSAAANPQAAPVTSAVTTPTVTKFVTQTAKPQTATVTATPAPVTVTAPGETVVQTAQVTVTEAASGPSASIKNGISLVGTDIQPGTYKSDSDDCYFARLSGTGNTLDDIIANGNGATIVTIDPSDNAFESRRCAPWTQVG